MELDDCTLEFLHEIKMKYCSASRSRSRNWDPSLRCPDLVGSIDCRCEIASVTVYAAYRPLPSNWLAKDLWTGAQGQTAHNKGTRNNARTIMIILTKNMAAGGSGHLFNDGQDMYTSTVCNDIGHLSHNVCIPVCLLSGFMQSPLCQHSGKTAWRKQ